ncbi:WYL domain-containing protein [Paenibacillus cymbidii]|uniref:WYL domain-containing protein n=1 Tax=Paenibacillus cymbidii TaxID=1639034 RepID=UPI00107FD742|nr:WYL domain-containing protein [Paenibacillus cymbidii]
MNPFEKIFNYQLISRLDESSAIALTSQERSWLQAMLAHEASADAFAPATLDKLRELLRAAASADFRGIVAEKAKSRERQVYHPLLRPLRRLIMRGAGIRITYRIKHGGVKDGQAGLPLKLEYSMVKREWYLLWYHMRSRALYATKLQHIVAAEETALPPERAAQLKTCAAAMLEERRESAVIEVVRLYNAELSRILYAFSCFDKSVDYDEATHVYRVRVHYLADESEFLLSKIRFLGLRVRVLEGDHLRRRMRESAARALERYGIGDV